MKINLFGFEVGLAFVIIAAAVLLGLIILIALAIIKSEKKEIEDPDTREEFGDFHGLLTKEDFEIRCDDPTLELYRIQWIKAEPGDEKDSYLLLYLALKQLNAEQDTSEEEWSQEQCEARMDEIIEELSAKTGIKFIQDNTVDEEIEEFFNEENDSEEEDDSVGSGY